MTKYFSKWLPFMNTKIYRGKHLVVLKSSLGESVKAEAKYVKLINT